MDEKKINTLQENSDMNSKTKELQNNTEVIDDSELENVNGGIFPPPKKVVDPIKPRSEDAGVF